MNLLRSLDESGVTQGGPLARRAVSMSTRFPQSICGSIVSSVAVLYSFIQKLGRTFSYLSLNNILHLRGES